MSALPDGACDTHIHVYDDTFPISPTAVLRPPNASLVDYGDLQRRLGIQRIVIVQPTTYGLDNRCQLKAVATVGDAARAVVVVDDRVTRAELELLTAGGARGARFHMLPGGALPWEMLEPVARRIADHGWHVQLQLDGRDLPRHVDVLRRLPVPIVVDHVGRFMPPVDVDHAAFRALLDLIDDGTCWVKLSAPYESTVEGAPAYPLVGALARRLVEHAPERLLWASNWPHPGQASHPTPEQLRSLLVDWLPTSELRRRVLVDNPAAVYGFPPIPHHEEPR